MPSLVVRNFFGILSTLLLFLTPMLTMGVYAEERKRGTMELLMTSPVTDTEIVLGKFFASLTLLVIMLLPTAAYFIYMFAHSEPAAAWRVLGCAYLGALLLGSALLALGSFFSSLTESQLIAAILTFGAILLLWVIDFGSGTTALGGGAAIFVGVPALRRFSARSDGYLEPDFLFEFYFSGRFSDGAQRGFDALAPRVGRCGRAAAACQAHLWRAFGA